MSTATRPPRVLVAVDEFHASLALVRGLRAAGYRPVVAVSRGGTYAAHSRAVDSVVSVPSAEDAPEAFGAAIVGAAADSKISAVLPGTEASLLALSGRREQLAAPLGAPPVETVELATDKPRVLELASACGLPHPPTLAGTPATLATQAQRLTYPAILKPQRTRLTLDEGRLAYFTARRVASAAALHAALAELPNSEWVLQPYLRGDLCAVSGVAWEGELVTAVHQRSLRIWPREVGYSCYAETTEPDRALEARVAQLLQAIGWSGIFQLQMLALPDGDRFAIDFNPRAYGSLGLAMRAGANLAGIWAALVLGEPPPRAAPRPGIRYRLETGDAKAIAALLAGGQLREACSALRPHRDTAHAIFALRDPAPAVVVLRKLLSKFVP